MFFGVALTVGAVQFFLDREQRRLRAPAERAAVAAAREVMFPLTHMMSMSAQSLAPDDHNVVKGSPADIAERWGQLMVGADLTMDSLFSRHVGSGFTPIPLAEFIAGEVRASIDAHRAHVAILTREAPTSVAAAIQDLMQGRGNQLLHILGWGMFADLGPKLMNAISAALWLASAQRVLHLTAQMFP
jgi:hypothetical protein